MNSHFPTHYQLLTHYMPGPGEFLEKAVSKVCESAKDASEIYDLHEDFSRLHSAKKYFDEHMEEFDDIDSIDVVRNPRSVLSKLTTADNHLLAAKDAVGRIRKSELRFSRNFLGPTIDQLSENIDDMNDTVTAMLHSIVDAMKDDGSFSGKIVRGVLSDEMQRGLTNLSVKLRSMSSSALQLRTGLQTLIDPKLKEHSNNEILNTALDGLEMYESAERNVKRAKETYDAFVKIKRAIDKIPGMGD